ncbi:MAG: hypothetical protein KO463_08405 [Candidatus Methanofastidiosa archaeon]|jgi:hypothetical protein|nr:hypothetical protein [Candidatus Methanofastidiosa archaeon]
MNNIVKKGIEHATDSYAVSILVEADERDAIAVLRVPVGVTMEETACGDATYVTFSGMAEAVMECERSLYELMGVSYADGAACPDMAEAHV